MTTRADVPYVGLQREHYEECARLVPALVKAKLEDRRRDVFELYRRVIDGGRERALTPEQTWSTFATAAIAYVAQLAMGVAAETGQEATDLLQRMAYASALWSLDGQ